METGPFYLINNLIIYFVISDLITSQFIGLALKFSGQSLENQKNIEGKRENVFCQQRFCKVFKVQ